MTKTGFVDLLASRTGLARQDAERLVNSFLDSVEDALCRDGHVALTGLGSLTVTQRSQRQGRSPQTGEALIIPASRTVIFRATENMRQLVKGAV